MAKSFAAYYDLYVKYRGDYQIDKIMVGEYSQSVRYKAQSAKFDERVMLVSLLLDAINEDTLAVVEKINIIAEVRKLVRNFTKKVEVGEQKPIDILQHLIEKQRKELEKQRKEKQKTVKGDKYVEEAIENKDEAEKVRQRLERARALDREKYGE